MVITIFRRSQIMIEWNVENTYYFAAIVTSLFVIISYLILYRRK